MKRIQYACLEQTIHFMLKEEYPRQEAIAEVEQEVAGYKTMLERKRARYRIVDECRQSDGSVVIKIKKQYNHYDCGTYLDD